VVIIIITIIINYLFVEALDRKYMAVLVLLDLSAAFDVIDNNILQTRLEHSFGVTGSLI